jgi:hypothetical protein
VLTREAQTDIAAVDTGYAEVDDGKGPCSRYSSNSIYIVDDPHCTLYPHRYEPPVIYRY